MNESTLVLQSAPFDITLDMSLHMLSVAAITSTARELPTMAAGTKIRPEDNGIAFCAFEVHVSGDEDVGAEMLPAGHEGHSPEQADDVRPARLPYFPSGQREHTAAPARE